VIGDSTTIGACVHSSSPSSLLAGAVPALAQTRQYAVLSLIGDKLQVTQYYPNEGFRNDGSLQTSLSLGTNSLDQTVLQAVNQTLKQVEPSVKPVLLASKDTSLYDAHAELMQKGQSSKALLDRIGPLLRDRARRTSSSSPRSATKRGCQQIKDTALGRGCSRGWGSTSTRGAPTQRHHQRARSRHPRPVRLLPLRADRPREARGRPRGARHRVADFLEPLSGDAWTALSNHDKIVVLQDMIRRETAKAVPSLVRMAR
jgi:hypothetical protein